MEKLKNRLPMTRAQVEWWVGLSVNAVLFAGAVAFLTAFWGGSGHRHAMQSATATTATSAPR